MNKEANGEYLAKLYFEAFQALKKKIKNKN